MSAQAQAAAMTAQQQALNMAEKLRAWKAQKAKENSVPGSASVAVAAASKPAVAKATATGTKVAVKPAATTATAVRKPASAVTAAPAPAPVAKLKRPFGAVTTATAATAKAAAPINTAAAAAATTAAKRAKTAHIKTVTGRATTASSSSATNSAASSARGTPAASTHTSPQQQQQPNNNAADGTVMMMLDEGAPAEAEQQQPTSSAASAIIAPSKRAPSTPPTTVHNVAAFTTPMATSSSSAAAAAASSLATTTGTKTSTTTDIAARLAAWRASRGVQLTATASKARVADEKKRLAMEVKAYIAEAAANAAMSSSSVPAATPSSLSLAAAARTATPAQKPSNMSSLSFESAFSRLQSLMRRGLWGDADRAANTMMGNHLADAASQRAEVWVCRAFIAEQLGQMGRAIELFDTARHVKVKPSTAAAETMAFQDVIARGFQSFMCRLAGVDAREDTERQPQVLDQFRATNDATAAALVAEESSAVEQTDAGAETASVAAVSAVNTSIADPNEDLGVSFSSVGGNSATVTPSHANTRSRLLTPVSASLRASIFAHTGGADFSAGRNTIKPSTMASAAGSFTPCSASKKLRSELLMASPMPTMSSLLLSASKATASTRLTTTTGACLTPAAASLASELSLGLGPHPQQQQGASSPEAGSMAALKREQARLVDASATKAQAHSAALAEAQASARKAQRALLQLDNDNSPSLSAPITPVSPSLSDSIGSPAELGLNLSTGSNNSNARRESLPLQDVVRTLFHEGVDALNLSSSSADGAGSGMRDTAHLPSLCASLNTSLEASPSKQQSEQQQQASIPAPSHAELEFLDASMADAPMMDEQQQEEVSLAIAASSSGAALFEEDEFIPGLSTPAVPLRAATSKLLLSGGAQRPAGSPSASGTKKQQRMLTPSKAARELDHVLEGATGAGSSRVVMASVRAHPRDALRLGSDTFLSPVRRSSRRGGANKTSSSTKSSATEAELDPEFDSLDQASLARLLEANNFAYQPNPALKHALTPIPLTRAKKSVQAPSSAAASMDVIEEEESTVVRGNSKSSSSSSLRQGTPIPSARSTPMMTGASVVVLQPVRSRSARRSAASADAPIDPRSAEYLLSPVRRSSRHTAPQSARELMHLLTHTNLAFKPNPLLQDESDMQLFGAATSLGTSAAPAATAASSMPKRSSASSPAAAAAATVLATPSNLAAIVEADSEEDDEEEEEKKESEQQMEHMERHETDAEIARQMFEDELKAQIDEHMEKAEDEDEAVAEADDDEARTISRSSSTSSLPAAAAAVAVATPSSSLSSVRQGTPMPLGKKKSASVFSKGSALAAQPSDFAPHAASAAAASAASDAATSALWFDKKSSASVPLSVVHEKDADGFFVPLLPSHRSNSSSASVSTGAAPARAPKRKHSLEGLEAQLSAVSVVDVFNKSRTLSSDGAGGSGTPRPALQAKRQRLMPDMAQPQLQQQEQLEQKQPRMGTPIGARRASRAAMN